PKLVEFVVALSIGMVLLGALIICITRSTFATNALDPVAYPMDKLGQTLLGDYLVPFEIVSVLLLVVMIGAAYLAKGRRRETDEAPADTRLSQRARQWS